MRSSHKLQATEHIWVTQQARELEVMSARNAFGRNPQKEDYAILLEFIATLSRGEFYGDTADDALTGIKTDALGIMSAFTKPTDTAEKGPRS